MMSDTPPYHKTGGGFGTHVVPVLELSLRAVWNRSGRKAAHMAVWSPALALEHVGINLPIGGPKEQELVARLGQSKAPVRVSLFYTWQGAQGACVPQPSAGCHLSGPSARW